MLMTYQFAMMGILAAPAFSMWALASRTPASFAPQQVWATALVSGFIVIFFIAMQGIGGHFLGADQGFLKKHPELVNPVMVEAIQGLDLMERPGKQDVLVLHLINLVGNVAPWLVALLAVCVLAAMQSTAACYMATAGSIVTCDLIRCFLIPHADDHAQKFVGRLSVVMIVVLALIVASTATETLALLGVLALSYGFQMWPALIAVCYWPFLTRQGVSLGLLAGLIAVTLTEPAAQLMVRHHRLGAVAVDYSLGGLGHSLQLQRRGVGIIGDPGRSRAQAGGSPLFARIRFIAAGKAPAGAVGVDSDVAMVLLRQRPWCSDR